MILVLLLMPVGYVELACRGDATEQTYQPLITDAAFQRREANTYLTYPEWHIVYAYDGLAEALKSGDEHAFDYFSSVDGFWRSTCALMRVADAHGGADFDTRTMIHTIGVSFTAEMAVKAAYEETIGRATAWIRGREKTPQDKAIAAMAVDYAAFLRQTPWYQYPFTREDRRALVHADQRIRSRLGAAIRHRTGVRGQGRVCDGDRRRRCGDRSSEADDPQRGHGTRAQPR